LLVTIQETIDRRVSAILAERGDWPCRKGCDECCRKLAAIPLLSEMEWSLLEAGLRSLATETQMQVESRIRSLCDSPARPITCPFLDREAGSCLVYDSRPLACRTYGFYVERDLGLYCRQIESGVERGEFAGVVWGNQASIDAESAKLGPQRSLLEWAIRPDSDVSQKTPGS
jgi:uncharacterized protein